MEFAVPEIADVVGSRKTLKTGAKSVGRQTLKKQLGKGSIKKVQEESLQQNLQNKPVGRGELVLQTFLINHFE